MLCCGDGGGWAAPPRSYRGRIASDHHDWRSLRRAPPAPSGTVQSGAARGQGPDSRAACAGAGRLSVAVPKDRQVSRTSEQAGVCLRTHGRRGPSARCAVQGRPWQRRCGIASGPGLRSWALHEDLCYAATWTVGTFPYVGIVALHPVFFPPDFQPYAEGQGVRRSHAEEAIALADQKHTINFEGLAIHMYARSLPDLRVPYTVHVTTTETPQGQRVEGALKVYDDLREGITALSPLEMLEAFASELGAPVEVGGREYRFLVSKYLPLAGTGPKKPFIGVKKEHGDGRNLSMQMHVKLSADKQTVQVAMAWCLDLGAYRAYLRAHL